MLMPADGIAARDFVQSDLQHSDFTQGVSFATRYDLVNQIVGQVEFQWYVTPNGDVAIEFPMFDFAPSGFGSYASTFTVNKHLRSASIEDEAEDVPNVMIVTTQEKTAQGQAGVATKAQGNAPNRFLVYAPLTTTRVGAVVESITAPVSLGSKLTQGQGLKNAEAWALIQFQKRVGAASTLSMPITYRPWILPNRPVKHEVRERIGLVTQVQHSIVIGGACDTTPVLHYLKKKHSDGKYRYPITGGENMAINYSTSFTGSGDVDNSGLLVRHGKTTGSSAGTPAGDVPKSRGGYALPPRGRQEGPNTLPRDKRWLTTDTGGGPYQRRPAFWQNHRVLKNPDSWVVHCGGSSGDLAGYLATPTPPGFRCKNKVTGVRDVVCGVNTRRDKASVHFVIEPNGHIYQMTPLDRRSNHAGRINSRSIGSEFRGPASKRYSDVEIQAFLGLVNAVRAVWPSIRMFYSHRVLASNRSDPGKHFPWDKLAALGFLVIP